MKNISFTQFRQTKCLLRWCLSQWDISVIGVALIHTHLSKLPQRAAMHYYNIMCIVALCMMYGVHVLINQSFIRDTKIYDGSSNPISSYRVSKA